MTSIARPIVLCVIPLALGMSNALAQQMPNLDVSRTCRAEAEPNPTKKSVDICIEDERKARELLVKEWGQFAADSKKTCLELSVGFDQSYVELLTCLETAKQATNAPKQ